MKHKLLFTLGLIVFGMVAFAALSAEAFKDNDEMPPWDQTLSASHRFIVLKNMSSQAVLDRETGLVWEQSPSTSTFTWEGAQDYCNGLKTGNRMGWRLPTLQELASLVDPSKSNPSLPSGHPFSNVQLSFYWSATTDSSIISPAARGVYFDIGDDGNSGKANDNNVWCVRGGQGVDPQ